MYNNQFWLVQRWIGGAEKLYGYINANDFLKDTIANLRLVGGKPKYKFIHLMAPHLPIVVNRYCEYEGVLENNRDNYKVQGRCVLKSVIKFLEKLKSLGIYDISLIILQADHGGNYLVELENDQNSYGKKKSTRHFRSNIVGAAMALLAIKPFNNREPLSISNVPSMLTDVPATIASAVNLEANFPHHNVFTMSEKEVRIRYFSYYNWKNVNWQSDFFASLDIYSVSGSVFDYSSWKYERSMLAPTTILFDEINFDKTNHDRLSSSGWAEPETIADYKQQSLERNTTFRFKLVADS